LRFLVDARLPPALARQIETLGHSAQHVADRGFATAARDRTALDIGRIVVARVEIALLSSGDWITVVADVI